MERRPIAAVLEEHADELTALPGVLGVGVGERDGAPCLRLFVARNAVLAGLVPAELEGYPVDVEETEPFHAR